MVCRCWNKLKLRNKNKPCVCASVSAHFQAHSLMLCFERPMPEMPKCLIVSDVSRKDNVEGLKSCGLWLEVGMPKNAKSSARHIQRNVCVLHQYIHFKIIYEPTSPLQRFSNQCGDMNVTHGSLRNTQ